MSSRDVMMNDQHHDQQHQQPSSQAVAASSNSMCVNKGMDAIDSKMQVNVYMCW
jgi:hypothetical protein